MAGGGRWRRTSPGSSDPMADPAGLVIRFADENDAGLILDFIRGLAEYERLMGAILPLEYDWYL